jgi:hypothetical protein
MSYSPLLWKSFDISDKPHQQLFMGQLTDLLNFLNSAQGLATLLNGNSLLGASALELGPHNLGNVTTNQTINAGQAASITGFVGVGTAFSPLVTFTNLLAGTPFSFRFSNSSGSTVTLKLAATNPAGTSYTIVAFLTGGATDMTATGLSVASGHSAMFSGGSFGTNLDLLCNLS